MTTRYVPGGAIERLLRSPAMVQQMHSRAEQITAIARFTSPYVTGQYVSSWRIYSGTRDGRAWARVANLAPYASFLEHGTRYMRRQRILGKAIAAARRR